MEQLQPAPEPGKRQAFKAVMAGAFAGILVQPFLMALWMTPIFFGSGDSQVWKWVSFMSLMAMVVALPFVVGIGVPVVLALQRWSQVKWGRMMLAGALSGGLLPAARTPYGEPGSSYSSTWHGRYVDHMINGKPTVYGWLSYLESVGIFALHGALGALAFYLAWRYVMKRSQ